MKQITITMSIDVAELPRLYEHLSSFCSSPTTGRMINELVKDTTKVVAKEESKEPVKAETVQAEPTKNKDAKAEIEFATEEMVKTKMMNLLKTNPHVFGPKIQQFFADKYQATSLKGIPSDQYATVLVALDELEFPSVTKGV